MPRKSYPSSKAISGMYLPQRPSSGNGVPISTPIPGRSFHLGPIGKRRPALSPHSGTHFPLKPRPIPKADSGTHFPEPRPSGKPVPLWTHPGIELQLLGLPSIKRRPPRRRGTKFIASSARKEGHLMWPSSCAGLSEQGTLHPAAGQAKQAHRPPSIPSSWRCNRSARSTRRRRSSES